MSFPTPLSPWFVVFRETKKPGATEYYRSPENESDIQLFTEQAGLAMLFTHLLSASRVADAEGAMIRALVSKDDAKEFGRG